MLDNYSTNEHGIIYQIERKPFIYDSNYVSTYNTESYRKNAVYLNRIRLEYCLSKYRIAKSILDIGYGNGSFLGEAYYYINNVYGYDISGYELQYGSKLTIDEVFNKEFDIVTFWDSLEHFPDINIIKNIKTKIICISLPYCHYNSLKKYSNDDYADRWFKTWKHTKPDEHLWHFDPKSLESFINNFGYKTIEKNYILEDCVRQPINGLQNIITASFIKD